jgi:predicted XRE-type DNA-binding protein
VTIDPKESAIMDDNTVTRSSGNVFADLGLPDAGSRLLKARVLAVIKDTIDGQKLGGQKAIADVLGLKQPDVSNLLRGRLSGFSLERLLEFASALGNDIDINVKRAPAPRSHERRHHGRVRVLVADAAD